jgi:MOSC domain-containing protein YiiM
MARLLSVNVGLPRDVSWRGEKVFTSVWKESVQGSRKVRRLNVDGDGQGDLSGHGGEHRAVLVYQMDSYRKSSAPARPYTLGSTMLKRGQRISLKGRPVLGLKFRLLEVD